MPPPPPPHPHVLPHTHRHAHRGEGCTGQRAPPENDILSRVPPSGHLVWAFMWNGEETAWKGRRFGEPSMAACVLAFMSASIWVVCLCEPKQIGSHMRPCGLCVSLYALCVCVCNGGFEAVRIAV